MRKSIYKILAFFLSIIISNAIFSQISVWDGSRVEFENGSGTEQDPYLIESAAHLAQLAYLVNNGIGAADGNIVGTGKYYKMTTDIDLNGSESFQWTPIGYYNSNSDQYYFGGYFDGDGHVVSNLYINTSTIKRAGLFGMVNGGSIKNLGITGESSINMSANGFICGTIVAEIYGIFTISNSYNTGNVYSAYGNCGGLIGLNNGETTINSCYNDGDISCSNNRNNMGGIIGYNYNKISINNCYNTGSILSSSSYTAGILGYTDNNSHNNINNCYNIGTATNPIVGYMGTTLNNCYYLNTSSTNNYYEAISKTEAFMKSSEFVDLLGYAFKMDSEPYVNNGYPILSGIAAITVTTKNASNIASTKATLNGYHSIGNITIKNKGFEYKLATDPEYKIINVNNNDNNMSYDLTELTPGKKYDFKAFVNTEEVGIIYGENLHFTTLQIADLEPWDGITITPVIPINNEYYNTYYIYSPTELAWVAQQCNNGNNFSNCFVILMNDIDLGGTLTTPSTWTPIGTDSNPFYGSFDGKGNIISNLYHNSTGNDNVGLFGNFVFKLTYYWDDETQNYLQKTTYLKNIYLNNVKITGKNNVGSIAGKVSLEYTGESIANCFAMGNVSGNQNIGGLIGYATSINIINSYFNGTINALDNAGGILGYGNYANLTNCYSTGVINANTYVGGICGWQSNGTFKSCYTTSGIKGSEYVGGIVGYKNSGNILNSYFDSQLAGINIGVGHGDQTGTSGKSTTEMTTSTGFGLENNTTGDYQSGWIYINELYPQLNIFKEHSNEKIAKASAISVSPIFLQNNETSSAVSTDFILYTANSVTWISDDASTIGINGASASISPMIIDKIVILTASLDNFKKNVQLNVAGANEILIYNSEELLLVANQCNNGSTYEGKTIRLMNDITLPLNEPNNMVSIGNYTDNKPFMGTFDGNGKIIYNVYIDRPNNPYQGFFGYTKDANLFEVGLVNITASGRDYTGGMVAYAENTNIKDCYVNGGTLFALSYVGGLVGYQSSGSNSVISGCYNTCEVSANRYVGGLIGYSDNATVRNSYVSALVNGQDNSRVGAIIGGAENVLMYNCYFSTEITGQSSAIGENQAKADEGLSNSEMQTQEFVNKINQGLTVAVWKKDYDTPINNKFPILIWQKEKNDCSAPANPRVNEVIATGVSLSWQGATDKHFLVEYTKTGGISQTTTTTSTNITLTDLDSNSDYSWKVKNVCSEGESEYIVGSNFKTGTLYNNYYDIDNEIKIFPNPAKDFINIEINNLNKDSKIQIYNIYGNLYYEQELQSGTMHTISLNNLSSGMYFLKINDKVFKFHKIN